MVDKTAAATNPAALTGARCLVTGGARGIGLSIAKAMLDAGARVAVCDLDVDQEATRELGEPDERWRPFLVDVAAEREVAECVANVAGWLGGVDVLVNNAGVNDPAPAHELGTASWQRVLSINLTGSFLFCRESARHMRGAAAIVNVASIHAAVGSRLHGGSAYAASKAGLVGLTKALAVEWAPDIRVNAITPTYVETRLARDRLEDPSYRQAVFARQPIPRLAKGADIAAAVCFLACPSAAMITGAVLPVDGGWLSS